MNFKSIGLMFFVILNFGFGVFVVVKNNKSLINWSYALFLLCLAFWSFALAMFYWVLTNSASVFWANSVYFMGSSIAVAFFYFSFVFPSGKNLSLKRMILPLGGLLLLFILYFFTPEMVKGIEYHNGVKTFIYGSYHFVFDVHFTLLFGSAFWKLYCDVRNLTSQKREQAKYFLLSTAIGVIFNGATNIIMPSIFHNCSLVWLGPYITFVMACIMTYAIVKYRLMDINLVLTRTGIFAFVYTLVLFIPFAVAKYFQAVLYGLLGNNWWLSILILGMLLATLGPLFYTALSSRAENILLKDQHRYQGTLRNLSATLTLVKDLERLLKLVIVRVSRAVKVDFACIYLANENKLVQKYPYTIKGFFPDFPKDLDLDSNLIQYISSKRRPVFMEELFSIGDGFNLRSGLIVPSFVRRKLLGFLLLGPKISGAIYTQEDANMFGILANQLALAIENSEFIEESQKTQAQLFAAEQMASLGTMAGGMTHQINNRFHAITMATSDTIDTLNLLNLGEASKEEVKDTFGQIKHALERIQENTTQGGKIVNDFLNFSQPDRLQKEAKEFDLKQPLERAVEMLRIKTAFPEELIVKELPKEPLIIQGNFVLLQDTFFNLMGNAIDALDKKKKAIETKELPGLPDYKGKIVTTIYRQDSSVIIQIQDNGIGMTEEMQKKIFVPFFTTKATTVKGTGFGLYVVQRIIQDAHQGTIKVNSEYGQGTTFTITLPVNQREVKSNA